MAFESLTDRFSGIIKKLRGQSRLTESNMEDILREIRIALLEADVNYKVVKEFLISIKEKAIGQDVFSKLSPSQMVIKIVHDEIETLLGSNDNQITFTTNGSPTVIMLVGLQGTGKTTSAGKLAHLFKTKLGKKPLLVACDVYRPAAIEQLETVSKLAGVDFFSLGTKVSPIDIVKKAMIQAQTNHNDVIIIDTAGRLAIDEPLMDELLSIQKEIKPQETLLLVDALSGQDAVNVAKTFLEKIKITGLIMSKLDGDSRGGSSLSIRSLTSIPIKFSGVGEKIDDIEAFYPDRMADRILGMGDVMTLIEKATENIDEEDAKKTSKKMMSGQFNLEDMVEQMKKMKKMGSIAKLIKFIPGMPKISEADTEKAEKQLQLTEVIINSMTPYERRNPEVIKNSRKIRIAKGSGTSAEEINKVLRKFEDMKKMMKQFGGEFAKGNMKF